MIAFNREIFMISKFTYRTNTRLAVDLPENNGSIRTDEV